MIHEPPVNTEPRIRDYTWEEAAIDAAREKMQNAFEKSPEGTAWQGLMDAAHMAGGDKGEGFHKLADSIRETWEEEYRENL